MFPMNETARSMFHQNAEIAQKLFRFGFDLQAQSMKLASAQAHRNLEAYNEAYEVSLKANRAMQEAWTNGIIAQLEKPAEAVAA